MKLQLVEYLIYDRDGKLENSSRSPTLYYVDDKGNRTPVEIVQEKINHKQAMELRAKGEFFNTINNRKIGDN